MPRPRSPAALRAAPPTRPARTGPRGGVSRAAQPRATRRRRRDRQSARRRHAARHHAAAASGVIRPRNPAATSVPFSRPLSISALLPSPDSRHRRPSAASRAALGLPRGERTLTQVMWTVCAEPVDSPDAVVLLRDYLAELTVRYFHPGDDRAGDRRDPRGVPKHRHCAFSSSAPTECPPAVSACTRRANSPASTSPRSFAAEAASAPCSPPMSRGPAPEASPTSSSTPAPTSSRPAPTSSRPAPSAPPAPSSRSPHPPPPLPLPGPLVPETPRLRVRSLEAGRDVTAPFKGRRASRGGRRRSAMAALA
ncbi:MAG: hypothetical protein QOJ29_3690 [Thermoleophilaceae bacterium]|nr:hypothetical protein [Thermoleophilaceae bacterium]